MINRGNYSERQRVLANFGDFVLDHDDLHEILGEACRLIAHALDAGFAMVMEIDPATHTGFARAGIGWRPGIVGHERIGLGVSPSDAFAIEHSEPVIANDIAGKQRFVSPSFLSDHGIVALVSVPILLRGRQRYGVLQVGDNRTRAFNEDDVDFLKTYAMVLGPAIDRLLTAAALRTSDERLRLIVENANAYVMVVSDADGLITNWLGGSETILGWSAAEVTGQPVDMIFLREDRDAGGICARTGRAYFWTARPSH